jgi:hypothetical protein
MIFSAGKSAGGEHWIEEVIPEGTPLYVLGFARPDRRATVSLKERTIERLRLLKKSPEEMHRFDADGDGTIGAAEWTNARREVERDLLEGHLGAERPPDDGVEIGRPPQRGLSFVIAETASETHMTGAYGVRSALYLTGGVLLGAWAIINLV